MASLLMDVELGHPTRVGIDGISASGKSTLARELTVAIADTGHPVVHLSVDDFHHPSAVRYRRHGRRSADGYYEDAFDFDSLVAVVLRPLGPGGDRRYQPKRMDLATDTMLDVQRVELASDGIAIVDGSFLQRPETAGQWDVVIFIDTPFDVARQRGIERDAKHFGGAQQAGELYDVRYHAAARRYLREVQPKTLAQMVVDNTNFDEPALHVQRDLGRGPHQRSICYRTSQPQRSPSSYLGTLPAAMEDEVTDRPDKVAPPRSRFGDVDGSGAVERLVDYLDAARRAPSVIEAKQWSLDRLDLHPGEAALDVGCGTGEDLVAMLERCPEGMHIGVDRSESMVSEARRRHGGRIGVAFGVADAHELPFVSETFDAVRCERTLQHIDVPATAVSEMARVLRTGGRLALLEPDWGTLVIEGADQTLTEVIQAHHVARHAQPRVGRQLVGLMTTEGLSVEEVAAGTVIYTDFTSAIRAFGLAVAAPSAAAAGILSQSDGEQWVRELRRADDERRFFASVTGFRAFGRRPG